MRILVTGASGFVGLNLVRALAALSGARLVAGDVLPWDDAAERFLAPVRDRVTYAPLDVRNAAAVRELIEDAQVSHIVHAAAITVPGKEEGARATEMVAVNLSGAVAVLDAAYAAAGVARVLLVSSSGLYGAPRGDPFQPCAEETPLDLTNLYAITKHSAELLAARYSALSGKPMASIRVPAVYGPMERVRASRPGTSVFYRLMAALQAGRIVSVAGPTAARDWTYAGEIGAAAAALLMAPRWQYSVYNVGCGEAITFAAVVEGFAAHGLRAEWVEDAGAAEIAMDLSQARAPLDITRLQRETGYVPRYDLQTGVTTWLAEERKIAAAADPSTPERKPNVSP